jgi:hypothetical protein
MGISVKTERLALLKQVRMEIKTCMYDSVTIRINICWLDGAILETGASLLSEPLYLTVGKHVKSRKYTIDIPGEVTVDGEELLLSIEFVHYFGEGYIQLPVYLGGGYCRKQAMARLEAIPFNSGIAISALLKK